MQSQNNKSAMPVPLNGYKCKCIAFCFHGKECLRQCFSIRNLTLPQGCGCGLFYGRNLALTQGCGSAWLALGNCSKNSLHKAVDVVFFMAETWHFHKAVEVTVFIPETWHFHKAVEAHVVEAHSSHHMSWIAAAATAASWAVFAMMAEIILLPYAFQSVMPASW